MFTKSLKVFNRYMYYSKFLYYSLYEEYKDESFYSNWRLIVIKMLKIVTVLIFKTSTDSTMKKN